MSTSTTSSRKRKRKLKIYLIDDEFNSFEHVITVLTALLPSCNTIKAESIASITHTTGKCQIAMGTGPTIFVLYAQLKKAGLTVEMQR
jgi:ATP-dependent Clp protease adapter protein ClpS